MRCVANAAPVALAAAYDLAVLPTWRDTSGLVVLEALASGTPVVTTARAGAAEALSDPRAGTVLARPGDVEALAAAIGAGSSASSATASTATPCARRRAPRPRPALARLEALLFAVDRRSARARPGAMRGDGPRAVRIHRASCCRSRSPVAACGATSGTRRSSPRTGRTSPRPEPGSFLDAFDLALEPLRPLQHLLFQVLALWDDPVPGAARLVSVLFHAGAVALVYALARELALPRADAGGAALLFALFPNVKGIAWSASISTPGRAVFVLAGFLCFLRALRTDAPRDRMLFALAFVLALAFHESAIVLPAVCVAWVALRPGAGAPSRLRAAVQALRDPALLSVTVATVLYVLYVAFLREERHHGLKSLASLPPNVVKASLVLLPELPRTASSSSCVRGRAQSGSSREPAGSSCSRSRRLRSCAAERTSRASRSPRSRSTCSCRPSARASTSATATSRRPGPRSASRRGGRSADDGGVRGSCSRSARGGEVDTVRRPRRVRRGRPRADAILDAACAARAQDPTRTIVLLDADDTAGAEHDIPLFNWGLPEALEHRGCAGPWLFWRTREYRTGTDVERVASRSANTRSRTASRSCCTKITRARLSR